MNSEPVVTAAGQDDARGPSNAGRALTLLWRISPAHVTGVVLATVSTSLIPAVNVVLTATAVQSVADAAGGAAGGLERALLAAGAVFVLMIFQHLVMVGRGYLETLLQYRMANTVNGRIMEHAARLELADFEDAAVYDRLQRATREASYRPYQIFNDLISTVSNGVTLLSVGAVLLTWDWRVALLVLFAPVPSMAANLVYSRMAFGIENARSTDRRRTSYLQLLVTNDRAFKETRLFDLGGEFVRRFRETVDGFYRVDRSLERRQGSATALLGMLSVAAGGGAVLFAVHATVQTGDVGRFAGFLASIVLVQSAVGALFSGLAQLYEHNLFLGNLFAFLDTPLRAGPRGGRPFPSRLQSGIEFRGVSFTYPGGHQPVLDELDLFLPAGRCVALVGRNGAGKTTMVKLLARFYEPTSGEILIDGVPLTEYDVDDLRRNIGVIFQDFVQYEYSARENVGFGRLERLDNDAAIRSAAADAGALDFLERLPHGLDSQLGRWFAEGIQLSGGQWQKVALARAFLRDAPVVVLDEPTASIDAAAEAEIFGRLTDITRRSTTLIIAHRFSTVRTADHIVVLDKGAVLERGTHRELMAADGVYAGLFRLQAAGYVDDTAPIAP